MKPGQFRVKLRPETPRSVWASIQPFNVFTVTATRLDDPNLYAAADFRAQAMYSGVVTDQPDLFSVEGQGLPFWLGTDDGLGDIPITDVALSSANLTSWVTALLPPSIALGTITNTGTTLSYVFRWTTPRESLDFACRAMGAEWRVNPNFSLDAAAPSTLFVNNPTAVITRRAEGPEGDYEGITTNKVSASPNLRGYTTEVVVVGQVGDGTAADGSKVGKGVATGANVYKDGRGNNVVMRRLVDAPNNPFASLGNFAKFAGSIVPFI